jgi:hypothetical protein
MKKKNILLPTDFSVNAHHAINYAIRLFERVPCTFHILNAFEASPSRLGSRRGHSKDTRLFRAIKSESKRNIQAIISELQLAHANPLHKLEG